MSSSLLLPRRLAPAVAILVACLCATPGSAHAAGCTPSFDVATRILTIDACFPDPDAPTIARISRTAAGSIQLDGQPIPGGPTVTNTDRIVYHGEDGNGDEVTLDMSNGQFAPGYTPELIGGKMEIEIEIDGGSGGGSDNFLTILGMDGEVGDRLEVGANGIDVADDDDSDIMRANLGRLTIDAQGGPDHLYGTGFPGYAASTAPLTLRGGPGNDLITGGAGSDDLSGGADEDVLIEQGAGALTLTDTTLTGNGSDGLAGFERVSLRGDNGPDTIDASGFSGKVTMVGWGGNDVLIGGPGDDAFRGHGGDDTIHGGPGSDLLFDALASVTLTDAMLSGPAGTDTLDSVERASLTATSGDDTLDASAFSGSADLNGGQGADALIAARGGGLLKGGDDADELLGGPGPDVFEGGAGDDRITSRDELTEPVDCGDGADTALADVFDGLTGCEQIDRGDAAAQPGDPAQPGDTGTPGADGVAPALSGLALSRRAFRAARTGAALAAAAGTGLRFTLSERATVTLGIERAAPGRRVGGRCQAPSARNRSRPACTRYVLLRGRLTHAGAEGANSLVFRGRLGRRALRPGRYRLVARATDAAGNRSQVRRANFRILAA